MPQLSTRCPYCFARMKVVALGCNECATEVKGHFTVPEFLNLSPEQQQFVMDFVRASGSLKQVAADYGISYPTVRARLDRVIEALGKRGDGEAERRAAILDAVEEKQISPQEASRLLASQGKR